MPTDGEKAAISEEELLELLRKVDLEALASRNGGLTAVVDWDEVLSLGEQQRLGMARLFYHRPKFAILDECTSGVTVCPWSHRNEACTAAGASIGNLDNLRWL